MALALSYRCGACRTTIGDRHLWCLWTSARTHPRPLKTAPEPRQPWVDGSSFARDFCCCRVAGRVRAESRTNFWGVFSIAFYFNATAPTDIYTLSLHNALPI